ncbi:basic salivary proline-rich protein 2-like [Vidua macroura]|uniref:basic salivary proline-rich protein 2-like n=1 Tax=Vidua macroura TaxID=187451 RepID=UPI0023A7CA40|nr:basic salivary proline-rich protein 2-like [Vidua macroura]
MPCRAVSGRTGQSRVLSAFGQRHGVRSSRDGGHHQEGTRVAGCVGGLAPLSPPEKRFSRPGEEWGARWGGQCGQSLPAAAAPGQRPEPAPAAAGKTHGAGAEPPPPPPPARAWGWGLRGPPLGRGQPSPPLRPPRGGEWPRRPLLPGPPSCPPQRQQNMTESSWSGMPWEGLGRLHLSKERSQ